MNFHKMFKIFAAFAICMLLIGCSAAGADPETGTDPVQTTTKPAETTTVPETTQPETTAPQFEELVLVDDENCTFTITAVEADNIFGYTLNVYLENKTDLELMFSVDDVSVNGYMCDPFWASTVSAGKKANQQISFSESDFETNGIQEVSDITFTLNVYDNSNWAADYLVAETFTVNP